MKNMFKFWGIIAFAAVIVFSMIGCGEDNSNDKNNHSGSVAGTWSWTGTGTVNSDGKVYGISSFTIIFNNDNTFEIKQYITTVDGDEWNGYMMAKGTYTVDGNKITITQLQHSENEGVSWSDTDPPVVISGITFTSTNISFPSAITTITLTKQTDNNNKPGDGSINFSDAKWSNINVLKHTFDEANQVSTFTPYNGSNKIFTKVILDSMDPESFSEISSNPSEWNIKIENNKLSISLGIPDLAAHFEDIHDSVNPDGLKVVINRFFRDDKDKTLALIDPASDSTSIWFAHADKAGIISGIYNYTDSYNNNITYNYNLNLKAGWNTVIFTQDNATITATMTTGVPSSNFKWVYYGDDGNNGDDGSIDFSDAKWRDIEVYNLDKGVLTSIYNGSDKTFTKAHDTPFSEISSNPADWNIKIVDNKLSIALGTPNLAEHAEELIPDSVNPDGLKVVYYQGFEDDNGNSIFLIDGAKSILFAHADKAGIVSGIFNITDYLDNNITINHNLNLKAGWNTIIFTRDQETMTQTFTTGVAGSSYRWGYYGN